MPFTSRRVPLFSRHGFSAPGKCWSGTFPTGVTEGCLCADLLHDHHELGPDHPRRQRRLPLLLAQLQRFHVALPDWRGQRP